MLRVVFLFFFVLGVSDAGFLYGSPCSVRNTAYLSINKWKMPPDEVRCVDITSMGKSTKLPHSDIVVNATVLYADHMNLRQVPLFVMEQFKELDLIDLSGNGISYVEPSTFAQQSSLRVLLLADNSISIPKKRTVLKSASLKTLSLSNNKIKRLRPAVFKGVPNLIDLFLDRNLLVKIHPKLFQPLKHLRYLHLGSNQLKVPPAQESLPMSLKIVILKGNPFHLQGNATQVRLIKDRM